MAKKREMLENGKRINVYLEQEEIDFYTKCGDDLGMPFVTFVRYVLRRHTGWRPGKTEQLQDDREAEHVVTLREALKKAQAKLDTQENAK